MYADIAIIGGGIVGLSIARELSSRFKGNFSVLEKEPYIGMHTSSRMTGVLHSGINQKPGTLKAKLCVEGNRRWKDYILDKCTEYEVPVDQVMKEVGTLVVATDYRERGVLAELLSRSIANRVPGVRVLDKEQLHEKEPYADGIDALYSPTGAIIDPKTVLNFVADDTKRNGVEILTNQRVIGIGNNNGTIEIKTDTNKFRSKYVINCAGLYADRIGHMMGVGLDYRIVPFRGEYYELVPEFNYLVNSMIYRAPNLKFPFLDIHFTTTVNDKVIVGPNAALALGRESYSNSEINFRELFDMLTDPRFLMLARNREFLNLTVKESMTSLFKSRFVRAAQRLVPSISEKILTRGHPSGIRAQLVDSRGKLVEDFVLEHTENSSHILNGVSPAFSSALASADHLVDKLYQEGRLDFLADV